MNKAVFLDRDGTINEEVGYLYKIEDFKFIEGVPEGIKLLNDNGFKVIVITNQAGVARGFYNEEAVLSLHHYMNCELSNLGARIDAFYYCPHHPISGIGPFLKKCNCRKPKPGLLVQASEELNLDLSASYMVGDKMDDVLAGINAGCKSILVKTGYGVSQQNIYQEKNYLLADNLLFAITKIILKEKFDKF